MIIQTVILEFKMFKSHVLLLDGFDETDVFPPFSIQFFYVFIYF